MSEKRRLSLYVPLEKQRDHPIERITALADEFDRPLNYLVVEAILQYLDRELPLEEPSIDEDPDRERSNDVPCRPGKSGEVSLSVTCSQDASSTSPRGTAQRDARRFALELADSIHRGAEERWAVWEDKNTVHVVMSRIWPPEWSGLSVDLRRKQVYVFLVQQLNALGWEAVPRNRFVRRSQLPPIRRSAPKRNAASKVSNGILVAKTLSVIAVIAAFVNLMISNDGTPLYFAVGVAMIVFIMGAFAES